VQRQQHHHGSDPDPDRDPDSGARRRDAHADTAPAGNRIVSVGQNGGNTFADQQSGSSTTAIAVGTTVEWRWITGTHSVTSGGCTFGCTPDVIFDSGVGTGMTFTRTFNQAGTFPYVCVVHGAMMQGTVIVQ
jgi:plastocyanin